MKNDRIEQIKKYIKKDLTDDFWRDVIYYEDILSRKSIIQKGHLSKPIQTIDIPKSSGVLRPGHYISFEDRFYYFDLLLNFCYKIDKKLCNDSVT